jgi:hypothetical protein
LILDHYPYEMIGTGFLVNVPCFFIGAALFAFSKLIGPGAISMYATNIMFLFFVFSVSPSAPPPPPCSSTPFKINFRTVVLFCFVPSSVHPHTHIPSMLFCCAADRMGLRVNVFCLVFVGWGSCFLFVLFRYVLRVVVGL